MEHIGFSFDFPPIIAIPLCIAVGITYAYLLYSKQQPWKPFATIFLSILRALLVTFITIFLIGTTVKSTVTKHKKPTFVLLIDNSISVREAFTPATWHVLYGRLKKTVQRIRQQGFEVDIRTFNGRLRDTVRFVHSSSNLQGESQQILEEYEGENLSGLIILSDGIYNSGISPLHSSFGIPVYPIGVGDTIQHTDVSIKSINYNKIALQGNLFPLSVELLIQEAHHDQPIEVYIYQQGKLVAKKNTHIGGKSLINMNVELEAKEIGLQHVSVVVTPLPQEKNLKNNRKDVYINVVKSQKRVLFLCSSPHPDNKAVRAAIDATTNYTSTLYIQGVNMPSLAWTGEKKPDVVVFRYTAHGEKMNYILNSIKKYNIPLFIMLGEDFDLQQWDKIKLGVDLERSSRTIGMQPIVNPQYNRFSLPEGLNEAFTQFPPASTFFRVSHYPPSADVLLWGREQQELRDRPLLFSFFSNSQAVAVLQAANIWKWRMSEFAKFQTTERFDLVFSKLIRYLGRWQNKENFKIFPIKNEFTVADPVVFESQIYNHLVERIYDHPVDLELVDATGKARSHHYVLHPGQSRYAIGELGEGTYTYRASTVLEGEKQIKTGEFRVVTRNIELQDLTADFMLLRGWAKHTGGTFYTAENIGQLPHDLNSEEPSSRLYYETHFKPLIDLKWLFVMLLVLAGGEWYGRKRMGGY